MLSTERCVGKRVLELFRRWHTRRQGLANDEWAEHVRWGAAIPEGDVLKGHAAIPYVSLKKAEELLGNLLKLAGYDQDILYMLAINLLEMNHPAAAQPQLEPAMRMVPEAGYL